MQVSTNLTRNRKNFNIGSIIAVCLRNIFPANIYLFKVITEVLEKGVKFWCFYF